MLIYKVCSWLYFYFWKRYITFRYTACQRKKGINIYRKYTLIFLCVMVVYIGTLLFLKIDIYLTRWRNRANFFMKRNLKHTIFAMFTQFQFCQLCRLNHKKKRKHIYSIRHQNVVNNILEKYLRKVSYKD